MVGNIIVDEALFKWLWYGVMILFSICLVLFFYVIPYAGTVTNKWKLRFMGKRGYTPVYMKYKNNMITEFIVNTKEPTFEHKDSRYNIRQNAFHKIDGIMCLFYEEDNPEPLMLMTDEDKEIILKQSDGTARTVKGKIVDAKLYSQTCLQYYYAGIAWANRNKNLLMIVMLIGFGLLAIIAGMAYYRSNQSYQMAKASYVLLQNVSGMIQGGTVL